ncbi:hypothetical protein N0V93_005469 [Gnomoniopsis smithogilvyi]|uniref:Fe2OG dioxygenase domain-containing protein n=1 Tax=Gnomoniopsis smithogilvyi TaxID=1191159 RepID=A0A9W9CY32_9PEZI|nr:hypothetical protein N0V93_005469 [Gnomoniopsis smithogilvyi]
MDRAVPPSGTCTGVTLPDTLDHARISRLPATAYYIPDFISEAEEKIILDKISSAPKPRWKQLSHRRLQTWPSDLVQNRLLDAPLPAWLNEPVVSRLLSIPLTADEPAHLFTASPHKRPNHVLINEYTPGIGIMPHKDGAAYHPVVCTVSLGASLCLDIYRSKDDGALDTEPAYRILQEPRSLLISTDDIYTEYLHGIADVEKDVDLSADTVVNWDMLRAPETLVNGQNLRATRTSLTYRDVLKVSKLGSNLGKFLQR